MIRPAGFATVLIAGCVLGACQAAAPASERADIGLQGAAPPGGRAVNVEQGRILEVRPAAGEGYAYRVQRIRDDSVIEVKQPDPRPLPAGLRVSISYGSPVRIEAAPTTPDLG